MRCAAVVQTTTHPHIVINFEIGIAGDFPLLTAPTLSEEALGNGPGVLVFDGSMIPNAKRELDRRAGAGAPRSNAVRVGYWLRARTARSCRSRAAAWRR